MTSTFLLLFYYYYYYHYLLDLLLLIFHEFTNNVDFIVKKKVNKKTCYEPLKNKLHNNSDNKNFVVIVFTKKKDCALFFLEFNNFALLFILLVSFVCLIFYLMIMLLSWNCQNMSVLKLIRRFFFSNIRGHFCAQNLILKKMIKWVYPSQPL